MSEREKENFFLKSKEDGMDNSKRIEKISEEIKEKVIADRNYLHQYPELGLAPETAKYISERLKKLGLEVKEGVAETGVIATLKGESERPCIIFKASLDGVQAEDESPKSPRSKNPGVSHACGHDVAMTYLLGCAEILSKIPQREGTVRFLFQPNEERSIIQESYALKMIKEGVIEEADAIFELHPIAIPEEVALSPEGRMNAASGRYKIIVHPKEKDVFEGKSSDAHTILSLITSKMGKYESQPEQLKNILVRTTFHLVKQEKPLKEIIERFGILPENFISFKITLKGPGGHAGASRGVPNLTFLTSEIVRSLYEKYGNSLFSFSKSIGKPAYNVLPTQTELWVTLKAEGGFEQFQQDVEKILSEVTKGLPVEVSWQKEAFDHVSFASEVESYSTIRIGEDSYLGLRKDIFSDLRQVLTEEMRKAKLTKPNFVEGAGEKMSCPPGEWRIYFQKGTPPQFNDRKLIDIFEKAARQFGVKEFDKRTLTSGTDFCYFGEKIPSAQVLLGSIAEQDFEKLGRKITGHTTKVEFTHESIVRGAKILALMALEFWERRKK